MDKKKPLLAVTMGEPAGIGPDIALDAWRSFYVYTDACFCVIGDVDVLQHRARRLGLAVPVQEVSHISEARDVFHGALPVLSVAVAKRPKCGVPEVANAQSVIKTIALASELTANGDVSAMVTNPIHKKTLYEGGFNYEGHTDYLADLAKEKTKERVHPVMMLCADGLKTVPLTVHIPLRKVADSISQDLIEQHVRVISQGLIDRFGFEYPRIAVTALNPHAGEGGNLGTEEQNIIEPAIQKLKDEGFDVTGPWSADSIFDEDSRLGYDAVLCMYHDQALIPVKTLGLHLGVNVTLGLPFIRTSPDHGTALDLAGSGAASAQSLLEACALAVKMANRTNGL